MFFISGSTMIFVSLLFIGVKVSAQENDVTMGQKESCPALTAIQNAHVTYSDQETRAVGSTVTVKCHSGFIQRGDSIRLCVKGPKWFGLDSACIDPQNNKCVKPEIKFAASVVYSRSDDIIEGTTMSVKCIENFEVRGRPTISCGIGGEWDDDIPLCVRKGSCGILSIKHAAIQYSQPDYMLTGSTVTIKCMKGYIMKGDSFLTCSKSISWEPSVPTCSAVCDKIEVTNGKVTFSDPDRMEGSHASISCDAGFVLNGSSRIICGDYKWEWGPISPALCDHVDHIPNGLTPVYSDVDRRVSSKVTYKCKEGFDLHGTYDRTCGISGDWSGSAPNCLETDRDAPAGLTEAERKIRCPKPSGTEHGRVEGPKKYYIGTVVTYVCEERFHLFGYSQRRCVQPGKWTNDPPSCIAKCVDLKEVQNGRIEYTDNKKIHIVYSRVKITCDPGFKPNGTTKGICGGDGKWVGPTASCVKA